MDQLERPHFGTDGVRGTYGENLTPHFVYCLGLSIARVMGGDHDFLIGRDTRISGPLIHNALVDGLRAGGAQGRDLGVISTPGIAMFAKSLSLPACAITASHNPARDNGIKVFGVGGIKIEPEIENRIESVLSEILASGVEYTQRSEVEADVGLSAATYVQYLFGQFSPQILSGLSVVLDCANGAAYGVAPTVFKVLGAEVHALNTESDGYKINDNCGATHVEDLCAAVIGYGADLGFAFDGDADRVIAVDEKGTVRDGDYILALFATAMKENGLLVGDGVVATSMSNGALKGYLQEHGITFVEVDVGDKYVLAEMLSSGYSLGGEQSGHIIRTDKATWGDGILNALLVSEIFVTRRKEDESLLSSQLFDLFEPLIQLHDKVAVKNKSKIMSSSELDGAIEVHKKILGEDSRIIIRPSGTEEVVRITVEAHDTDLAQNSVKELVQIIEKVCVS